MQKSRRRVWIWDGQGVPLEEGLAERGWEVDIVACICQQTICLEGRHVPRIEEAVNGGRWQGRNIGSGYGARR